MPVGPEGLAAPSFLDVCRPRDTVPRHLTRLRGLIRRGGKTYLSPLRRVLRAPGSAPKRRPETEPDTRSAARARRPLPPQPRGPVSARPCAPFRDSAAGGIGSWWPRRSPWSWRIPPSRRLFRRAEDLYRPLSLLHWINDLLMACSSCWSASRSKREFLDGQLSTWPRRVLPGVAAAGGMRCRRCSSSPSISRRPRPCAAGPSRTATDIAFALGVLALLGSRVPVLAQDLPHRARHHRRSRRGHDHRRLLHGQSLHGLARRRHRRSRHPRGAQPHECALPPALPAARRRPLGAGAEVRRPCDAGRRGAGAHHPAARRRWPRRRSIIAAAHAGTCHPALGRLRHRADLRLRQCRRVAGGFSLASLLAPLPLGIAAGLFVGKQIGVFGTTWAAVRLGWADRPEHATWPQVYGRRPALRHRLHHEPVHRPAQPSVQRRLQVR